MAQQLAAIRYQDTPVVSRVEPDVGHRDLDLAKVAHHHRTVWTGFLVPPATGTYRLGLRSEEHTSELQSLMRSSYAVFCLKNKKTYTKEFHNNDLYNSMVSGTTETRQQQ